MVCDIHLTKYEKEIVARHNVLYYIISNILKGVDMAKGMVPGHLKEPLFNRPPGEMKVSKIDPPKEDFKDVFKQHSEQQAQARAAGPSSAELAQKAVEDQIAQVNGVLSGNSSYELEREMEDLKKITPEDMKLAEEMIFKGYAETTVSMVNLPNVKFTIMSMSADEISLVDVIVFDFVKSKESRDGETIETPQTVVTTFRNNLILGLAVKGRDGKDMCEDSPTNRLELLKRAIRRMKMLEVSGDIEKYTKLLEEIKRVVRIRASFISGMATPVIDFLADQKYQFEIKMFRIMTAKQLIPKS